MKTKKLHLALFGSTGPDNWLAPSGSLYDWRQPDLVPAEMRQRARGGYR